MLIAALIAVRVGEARVPGPSTFDDPEGYIEETCDHEFDDDDHWGPPAEPLTLSPFDAEMLGMLLPEDDAPAVGGALAGTSETGHACFVQPAFTPARKFCGA